MAQALTTEFLELAIELIDEFCTVDNAVWQSSEEGTTDPAKPWEQNTGLVTEYDVRLILIPHGMETLKYMSSMETIEGHVVGYMYPVTDFVPSPKDTVLFQDEKYNVEKIIEYRPVDEVVLYELDLLI